MAHRLTRPLAALLIACLAPGWTHAAELGEPHVSSFIGQQLVADIELAALEDPAGTVGVKLASQDVYRGASIAMPPVLASLNMTVMRRDGRQFLHLTSLRPVDADHLHVFLELADGGKRSVRLATLWLTADPNPAPAYAPVAAPASPVPAPAAPAVGAAAAGVNAAPPATRSKAGARQGQAAAPARVQPPGTEPPVKAVVPRAPVAVGPAPRPKAAATVGRAVQPPAPLPVHPPLPVPLHQAPQAACVQQPVPAQASACLALDGKNAALRAEIGHLETQVKALQAALQAPPAAAPKPRLPGPRKRAPKKAPEEHTPLWIWIAAGAAALAATGAALVAWRRGAGKGTANGKKTRKSTKPEMDIVVTPRVMGDVRSRLMTEGPPSRMPAGPQP